eukprot:360054-Hanusia_phi.AAC.1
MDRIMASRPGRGPPGRDPNSEVSASPRTRRFLGPGNPMRVPGPHSRCSNASWHNTVSRSRRSPSHFGPVRRLTEASYAYSARPCRFTARRRRRRHWPMTRRVSDSRVRLYSDSPRTPGLARRPRRGGRRRGGPAGPIIGSRGGSDHRVRHPVRRAHGGPAGFH